MLYSKEQNFVFIKTAKTAGTLLEAKLQKYCLPCGSPFIDAHAIPCTQSASGVVGYRGAKLPRFSKKPQFYNHMPAYLIRKRLGEEIFDQSHKIISIRNPYFRAISAFHHFCRIPYDATPQFNKDLFLNFTKNFSNQYNLFFFKDKLIVDTFIKQENLIQDMKTLSIRLGIDENDICKDLPNLKVSNSKFFDIKISSYFSSDSHLKKFNEKHWFWFTLGGYEAQWRL